MKFGETGSAGVMTTHALCCRDVRITSRSCERVATLAAFGVARPQLKFANNHQLF